MAGFITDFFGYRAEDRSETALRAAATLTCPFIHRICKKTLSDGAISGACAVRQVKDGTNVICCPARLYAQDYLLLETICRDAFDQDLPLFAGRAAVEGARQNGGAIAVFGQYWGGELRLPQREGSGSYFVDWVLARLNNDGNLVDFTAVEVQSIDTIGNYHTSREALLSDRSIVQSTVGLNWENVSKRIIPQIIYKGQVLQREDLCRTGLYFVSPKPVHDRILKRLGGRERLPVFPVQPASVHFIAYDYQLNTDIVDGEVRPLSIIEEHCTTVYRIQQAFSELELPHGNVYRDAIQFSLFG